MNKQRENPEDVEGFIFCPKHYKDGMKILKTPGLGAKALAPSKSLDKAKNRRTKKKVMGFSHDESRM